jgi:cholesterol oxidase
MSSTGTGRPRGFVRARQVVLAAGTLGTHDLLHRSRAQIPLGPRFGQHLSMNGDGLAFLYDTRAQLSSHSGAPISTSARIPFEAPDGSTRTLTVMSGRVPMAAMRFAGAALAVASGVLDDPEVPRDDSGGEPFGHLVRRARDLLRVGANGAMARSFMYKLDGQDAGRGVVRFTPAGAVIDWKDYADDPVVLFAERRLRAWAATAGGTVIPNIARLPGMRSFSVHPLGGCRIGATIDDGVVDELGQVFDPRGGVYPGLRIADGSILPGSPGVPPSFTIAALAERIAESMIPPLTA